MPAFLFKGELSPVSLGLVFGNGFFRSFEPLNRKKAAERPNLFPRLAGEAPKKNTSTGFPSLPLEGKVAEAAQSAAKTDEVDTCTNPVRDLV